MIAWGRLLLALAQGLASLLTYVRERQLISLGEEKALADVLKGQVNAIEQAHEARAKARASNAVVPKSSSLPDDGHRRD